MRFARALRSPSFAFLWGGQTISMLEDGAFTVALAWSVLQLTGSATALAEVLAAQGASRFIFLLIGGVLADRLPRRAIIFCSDAIRAAAVLLIAFLFWRHLATLIPDASFDYVHQRHVAADVPADAWPKLVGEAVRVTKPGGWIELVEGGPIGPVSADCVAVGELVRVTNAWRQSRGVDLALAGCLAGFLHASEGFVSQSLRSFDVPLALGAEIVWGAWSAQNWLQIQHSLRPLLLQDGFIAENGEYERLIRAAGQELRAASIPWPVHVAYAQRQ